MEGRDEGGQSAAEIGLRGLRWTSQVLVQVKVLLSDLMGM